MNEMSFDSVFRAAFGKAGDANFQPYAYQCRLACGEPPEAANADLDNPDEATRDWLSRPDPGGCRSRLIDIPTGLGKTAAVVLAWLWNRTIVPSLNSQQTAHGSLPDEGESTLNHSKWPRRLVYMARSRLLRPRDIAFQFRHVIWPADAALTEQFLKIHALQAK